jgi:hypothetical protein
MDPLPTHDGRTGGPYAWSTRLVASERHCSVYEVVQRVTSLNPDQLSALIADLRVADSGKLITLPA